MSTVHLVHSSIQISISCTYVDFSDPAIQKFLTRQPHQKVLNLCPTKTSRLQTISNKISLSGSQTKSINPKNESPLNSLNRFSLPPSITNRPNGRARVKQQLGSSRSPFHQPLPGRTRSSSTLKRARLPGSSLRVPRRKRSSVRRRHRRRSQRRLKSQNRRLNPSRNTP